MALIRDPKLSFLNVSSDKADRKEHNTAITVIAAALSKLEIEINYDHVESLIPKNRNIPLSAFSKKRAYKADLAFMLYDNTLVHVHVDVFHRGPPLTDANITDIERAKKKG